MSVKMLVMQTNQRINIDRIRELMHHRRWDIGQLSQQTKLHYNTIYRLLNPKHRKTKNPRPPIETLTRIAQKLGTTIEELLITDEEEVVSGDAGPSDLVRDLIERVALLSVRRQQELLRLVETYQEIEEEEQDRLEQDIRQNQHLLTWIEKEGGELALGEFFALVSSVSGIDASTVAEWINAKEPPEDE